MRVSTLIASNTLLASGVVDMVLGLISIIYWWRADQTETEEQKSLINETHRLIARSTANCTGMLLLTDESLMFPLLSLWTHIQNLLTDEHIMQ